MKDINIQILEIEYVINLGQLLRIVPNIKIYIFKSVKSAQLVQLEPIQLEFAYATMVIND